MIRGTKWLQKELMRLRSSIGGRRTIQLSPILTSNSRHYDERLRITPRSNELQQTRRHKRHIHSQHQVPVGLRVMQCSLNPAKRSTTGMIIL